MVEQTIKEFLKPNWRKVFLFTLILIFLTFFLGLKYTMLPEIRSIIKIGYPPFLTITEGFLGGKTYEWNFANLALNIVVWYPFSCFFVWIFGELKEKIKQ